MTDKEVGEIWRWVMSSIPDDADVAMDTQSKIAKLIHKLVEDRYRKYDFEGNPDPLAKALADFAIPPEDWK